MSELSKEIKELIKNAPEKPIFTTKRYDGILISPQDKDSAESGYRDLEIFGVIKSEEGLSVEKIKDSDVLEINSLFKKLKGFSISIDIPYSENVIHISCYNHLIEVNNTDFRFVKDKRK